MVAGDEFGHVLHARPGMRNTSYGVIMEVLFVEWDTVMGLYATYIGPLGGSSYFVIREPEEG